MQPHHIDSRPVLQVGGHVHFSYPHQSIGADLLGSAVSTAGLGVQGQGQYTHFLQNGRIGVGAGLSANYYGRTGLSVNANGYYKVMEIRKGLYNPNLFVGDMYGNLFFHANYSKYGFFPTIGAAAVFEAGIASSTLLTPSIGLSLSAGEVMPFIDFSFQF